MKAVMIRLARSSSMALAASLVTATSAWAQTSAPPQEADALSHEGIEDIVVTAQRRREVAQSVPVSITAVSAETLEAGAVKGLSSVAKSIIGVQLDSQSLERPELYIRGIGTNRFDTGGEPSSGVYIDEIYQPRASNALGGLVDLDRIEVLRGPQGTLFGRNTIGGAISVYTPAPEDELEGAVSGSYGNKDYVALDGHINLPFSDKLRSRFSAGYSDRDGFMRDRVSGRDDGVRIYSVRGKIVGDLNDDTTLQVTASRNDADQRAVLLNPATLPLFLSGPLAPQVADTDRYSGDYTMPGENRVEYNQVDARLIVDADQVLFTVIGGYIDYKSNISQDSDGAINDNLSYVTNTKSDTYSLELRLSSQDGGILTFGDRFRWVTGAYVYEDKAADATGFTVGKDSILSFLAANPGALTNPLLPPPYAVPTLRYTDVSGKSSDLKSLALFGQGTFQFTDQIAVTMGGRYTSDDREYTFFATSDPNKPFPLPLVFAPFSITRSPASTSFDPRVSLEVKPVKDVLFYASYSTGYKSSSIQPAAFDAESAAFFTRPETVKAYEIGLKSDLFDRRLRFNVAGFVNKFDDLQVRRVVSFPSGFATALIENAASSTIKGIEVESSFLPARGFRINASYAYLDAAYDSYVVDPNPANPIDFSGNRLPRAPKHRFNVDASYGFELANGFDIQLRAEYNHTGSFFFASSNLPIEREEAFGLANASTTVTLPNGNTSLQLWGRNVFGVEYRTYLDVIDPARLEGWSDKATYGLTLSHRF